MPPLGTKLSIDRFASGPFRPHGRIELWTEGNVVRLNAMGPFNKEAVVAMGATWRQLFAELPVRDPFADIVTITGSMMAGPDVLQAFASFLQANTSAHIAPCAVAWVVSPEVEGVELMTPQFEHVYELAGRNIRFFDSDEIAVQWVRQQLQRVPATSVLYPPGEPPA